MERPDNNLEQDNRTEVSVGDLIYKYLSYWPLFLLLLFVMLVGAKIYLRYTPPVYETTASLLIKNDNTTSNDQIMSLINPFGTQNSVENEVEILQSITLMKEIVRNLNLYAPVTVEGRVMSQDAYVYSPIIVKSQDPDTINTVVPQVYFKYDPHDQTVDIDNQKYPLNRFILTPYGVLEFLPNPLYKSTKSLEDESAGKFYFSIFKVKSVANSLTGQIKVSPSSDQSTVIDLSIRGEVPERGEAILNELLKVYNQAAIMDKNVLAANTLKFVDGRLKIVTHDLDSIENRLQQFKAQNKITDISAQGQIFLQTVAANDQKISDLNMQLSVLDQVEDYVKGKGDLSGIDPTSFEAGAIAPATLGVGDPVLTEMLQNLSDLQVKYAQTRKLVPENNPSVIALKDAINKLKPGIIDNILGQRRNLTAARNDLEAAGTRYSSMLKVIPEKERELLNISRQQSIKNDIYTFLLTKREETALSLASVVSDIRVIDHGESSDLPVSPVRSIIYLGAALLAFLLGVLYVFLKDAFTRTIQSRKEIEKNTSVPILGELVFDTSKSPIVIREGKRTFIAEQFRQIRTALSFMGIDGGHKRVLVTSSISGEGKSFTSLNLGISLSLTGKKVALLELDLRNPKLGKELGLAYREGISNYLIGKLDYSELVHESGFKNLFLVPSGPIPPNPSELISNSKMEELLSKLESEFDYLILDAPPVKPVTDATILSSKCNTTLFLVRHEYTPREFLQEIEQRRNAGIIKNPAIILNGIKIRGMGQYGYGRQRYGRKYGYGYGYGYAENASGSRKWWQRIF